MLKPQRYYPGSALMLKASFYDEAGRAVAPDAIAVRVMAPDGVDTTYTYGTDAELTNPTPGRYVLEIVPDKSGLWTARWEASEGTGDAARKFAHEEPFRIAASPFYDNTVRDYS